MDVDIDNDFDGKLLDQFRSMGTTDRDVLIAEFQAVLGNKLNPESCAFFLDMNNWNLQNAVCSYYDFEQPANTLPSMTVLADVTVGDGESVATNTTFFKSWRIRNSGTDRWPPGCHLRFCSGDNLTIAERKMVEPLDPGQMLDIHVEMRSPSSVGTYISLWRMCTPTGTYFGDVININVVVADGGLLGITQQLSRIGGEFVQVHPAIPAIGVSGPFGARALSASGTDTSEQQQHVPYISSSLLPQSVTCSTTIPSSTEEDDDMS